MQEEIVVWILIKNIVIGLAAVCGGLTTIGAFIALVSKSFRKWVKGFIIKNSEEIIQETKQQSQAIKEIQNFVMGQTTINEEVQDKLAAALDVTENMPRYREQSQQYRDDIYAKISELTKAVQALGNNISSLSTKQNEIEKDRRDHEKNKIRLQLLEQFKLYANKEKNPTLAWSSAEAKCFWDLYNDYISRGGNDFVHDTVCPAMIQLKEIPLSNEAELGKVMHQRCS